MLRKSRIHVTIYLYLGQFSLQQLKVFRKEQTENMRLVQIKPGFIGGFDMNWVSHDGGLVICWILFLFPGY